jgi:hypothetical protein
VSNRVKAAPGLLAGNSAARLPSRWDQVRAACRTALFALSGFMALAFAEVRRDRSSSLVTANGFRRKAAFAERRTVLHRIGRLRRVACGICRRGTYDACRA